MNVESYNFTVVATVLGMLVVFLSLTFLSLLMVGLKASFGDRAAGGGARSARRGGTREKADAQAAASGKAGGTAPAGGTGTGVTRERKGAVGPAVPQAADDEREPPPWLPAAVAAYLAGAEREGPSVVPWLPEFNHFDPWLAPGRSTRSRGTGPTQQ